MMKLFLTIPFFLAFSVYGQSDIDIAETQLLIVRLDSLLITKNDTDSIQFDDNSDFHKQEEERIEWRQNWRNEQNSISNRADALMDLTYSYLFENLDSVYQLNNELISLCEANNLDTILHFAYTYQGFYHGEVGKYFEAMKFYRKAEHLAKAFKDTTKLAGCYINRAELYLKVGKIEKSTKLNNKALDLFRAIENYKGQGLVLLNLGSQYEDTELSAHYTRAAIQILENKTDSLDQGHQLAWYLSTCYSNLAEYFLKDSIQLDSSFYYFNKGLELAIEYQIYNQISGCLGGVGSLYFNLGAYEIALQYGLKSYEFAIEANYLLDIVLSTDLLYKIQKKLGNNEEALRFYEEHEKFKDSLDGVDANMLLLKDEFDREMEELKNKERNQKNRERLSALVLLIVIIVPLAYWIRSKYRLLFDEKATLLKEIKVLKDNSMFKTITSEAPLNNSVILNKDKLETRINNKLNETDWKILNLLYDDPIIMNKILAQKVSLSLEGVSSSLRKMYRLFEIKDGKNKKIALLLESIRISSKN